MTHSAKNNIAVTRGAAMTLVIGDIKLSALKLYATNGSVKTVAAIVTLNTEITGFKNFILLNFSMILLFMPFVSMIPSVAKNDN